MRTAPATDCGGLAEDSERACEVVMQEIQQLAMQSVRERREAAANRDLLVLTIGLIIGALLDAGIRIYG